MVQFIKAKRESSEKLSSSSHGLNQKAIFPAMVAADGSLGRSSEDQQNTAAAVVVWWGPLRTQENRDSRITQDHKLYAVFDYADIHLTQGVGFNEKKRHGFLKVMEKPRWLMREVSFWRSQTTQREKHLLRMLIHTTRVNVFSWCSPNFSRCARTYKYRAAAGIELHYATLKLLLFRTWTTY